MKPKYFDASLPFSHTHPYDELYRERIPLLVALHTALANHRAGALKDGDSPTSDRERKSVQQFFAAECGVYSGNALVATGKLIREFGTDFKLFGFDTFVGLPELSEKDERYAPENAAYRTKKLFTDTSFETVRTKLREAGLLARTKLFRGLFADVFPKLGERTFNFVNIDCDLYEPHLQCLEYFYPRMRAGGVLYFDDYHSVEFPMARHAIDEFMAGKPEQILHVRYGADGPNHTKSFVVKF